MVTLADVPVGATFLLGARLAVRDQRHLQLLLLTADRTVQGHLAVILADSSVAGLLAPPASIPVSTVAGPVTVGDVLRNDQTGECMVVRAVWAATDGFRWSNTPDRRTAYTTQGWTKAGQALLV